MPNLRLPRHSFVVLSLLVLATVAGCVQPASDEVVPAQVGEAIPTFTPGPTNTDVLPTDLPTATEEGDGEQVALQIAEETATPTETASTTPIPSATLTATLTPSATPTATSTAIPTATAEELSSANVAAQTGPTEVADAALQDEQPADGEIDPVFLTATEIVLRATLTEEFLLTSTAEAGGIGNVEATPVPAITEEPTQDLIGQGGDTTQAGSDQVTQPITPGTDCVHEVRSADRSLYRLSLAYGVTVQDIATASGIVNPDLIRIGQRLTIPGCGTTGGVPPATSTPGPNQTVGTGGPGTTTTTTDCTFGTTVTFPGGCPTGTTNTAASTGAATGGPTSGTVHQVLQGQTLFQISLIYGVDVQSIAAANGIGNIDLIDLGDELIIP